MADGEWHPSDEATLREHLSSEARTFGFFQAVRLLRELALQAEHRAPDELAREDAVGGFGDPGKEAVRFTVPPSIAFPVSEIQEIGFSEDGPPVVAVNFFGLTGPKGVLPYIYTQLAAENMLEGSHALQDFLDIFHHRLVSLFFRAWEKSRPLEVMHYSPRSDHFTAALTSLLGFDYASSSGQRRALLRSLVAFVGLLSPGTRSGVNLQNFLRGFLGVPVEVVQFLGSWLPISRIHQCSLGDPDEGANRLGKGAVLGDEVWDQQSRIRIRIGPLSRSEYDDFLPEGRRYELLRTLTRFFCNDEFDIEAQLILEASDVPGVILEDPSAHPQPLGWCTWVSTSPFKEDAADAIFQLK